MWLRTGSDIDLDDMTGHGIIVTASNTPGYEFTNLDVDTAGGQAVVELKTGGSLPPKVLINGGSESGNWALGAFPTPAAGNLTVVNVIGYDIP